jgi:hypothetical protein
MKRVRGLGRGYGGVSDGRGTLRPRQGKGWSQLFLCIKMPIKEINRMQPALCGLSLLTDTLLREQALRKLKTNSFLAINGNADLSLCSVFSFELCKILLVKNQESDFCEKF